MTANNMSSADTIISGKIIKVPLSSSGTSTSQSSLVSSKLKGDFVDANILDILSAIAINANYTILYDKESVSEDKTVTISLEEMYPLKAIDYITRLNGLAYLKDGNTVIIGTPDALNSTFIDKIVMSKFSLKYITAEALQSQASALGLSNVQYVTTEQNTRELYISAYPKELAKIKELISILDVSSNIMSGSALITSNFTSIDLQNISATEFSGLLANLGLDSGIVLASRPFTLFTFVTGAALADIKAIKNIVDKPLSGANLAIVPTTGTDTVVTTAPSTATTTNGNSTTTNGGSTGNGTVTTEDKILREINLNYIDRDAALEILASFPLSVSTYGPEKMTKKIWLLGKESEVNEAQSRIQEFDTEDYSNNLKLENTFFPYLLKNCTAQEMIERLKEIDVNENVTIKSNNHPSVSKSIFVYCDYAEQDKIKTLLDAMDSASTGEEEYRVVEVISSASTGISQNRISSLRSLHPEIPAASEFEFLIVPDKTGNPRCITYVKASTEMVDYVMALLDEMDAG